MKLTSSVNGISAGSDSFEGKEGSAGSEGLEDRRGWL